jgi:hypothetical protein
VLETGSLSSVAKAENGTIDSTITNASKAHRPRFVDFLNIYKPPNQFWLFLCWGISRQKQTPKGLFLLIDYGIIPGTP